MDEVFPGDEIESLGYNLETHGQKGFNGVAILSKIPFEETHRGLPVLDDEVDEQARFIEGVFSINDQILRVVSLYLPNGNPVDTEKYPYKINWMKRLEAWATERLGYEEALVLAGDYNVIPVPEDCYDPEAWEGDALYRPESREAYRRLLNLGLNDAVRNVSDANPSYTFWDFQGGAWPKNHGIRIDHLLLSPEASNLLNGAQIDRFTRQWEKPSDHVPVWIDLAV